MSEDDWIDISDLPVADDQPVEDAVPEARPFFTTLDAFVGEYLLRNWRVYRGGNAEPYWCAKWWLHAEAITRFSAIWQTWEVARLQPPPAMSLFWRDHADPHMAWLTGLTSPFRKCANGHQAMEVWPCEPAPQGFFPAQLTLPGF